MNPTALALYNDMNPQMQQFVDKFFELGGSRGAATEAVKVVYGYEGNAASVQANRLLKSERIQKIMQALTAASFAPLAVMAADQLGEILQTGMWHGQKVKPSDGLKVMKEVLERGVGKVADKTEVEITDNRSVEEIKAALVEKLQMLNPEERASIAMKLSPEAPIDADFVAIKAIDPEAPWGRRADGTPSLRKGRRKTVLPGPQAYKPPVLSDYEAAKRRAVDRAAAAIRAKYSAESAENV